MPDQDQPRPACRLQASRRRSGCVPAERYPPLEHHQNITPTTHNKRATSEVRFCRTSGFAHSSRPVLLAPRHTQISGPVRGVGTNQALDKREEKLQAQPPTSSEAPIGKLRRTPRLAPILMPAGVSRLPNPPSSTLFSDGTTHSLPGMPLEKRVKKIASDARRRYKARVQKKLERAAADSDGGRDNPGGIDCPWYRCAASWRSAVRATTGQRAWLLSEEQTETFKCFFLQILRQHPFEKNSRPPPGRTAALSFADWE